MLESHLQTQLPAQCRGCSNAMLHAGHDDKCGKDVGDREVPCASPVLGFLVIPWQIVLNQKSGASEFLTSYRDALYSEMYVL